MTFLQIMTFQDIMNFRMFGLLSTALLFRKSRTLKKL
jgi:hypothetical protein